MNWWLTFPSWIVAFYFGYGFVAKAGFPPKTDLLIGDALFVSLSLFFLFLPYYKKIKIGSWIELERQVEEAKKEVVAVKEELREFKNEVRNTVTVSSTNAVSQHINVHLPPAEVLRRQQVKVDDTITSIGGIDGIDQVLRLQAELQSDDILYALAGVRIDIERSLRVILIELLDSPADDGEKRRAQRYLTIEEMFEMLVAHNSRFAELRSPLRNVLAVCNAAIHAQPLNPDQAVEALKLGARLVAILGAVARQSR